MSSHSVAQPTRIRLTIFGAALLPMFVTGLVGGLVLAEWSLPRSVAAGGVVGLLVATRYAFAVSTDRSSAVVDDDPRPVDDLVDDERARDGWLHRLWDVPVAYVVTAAVMIPTTIVVALFMCRTQVLILVGFALLVGRDVTALDLLGSVVAVIVFFFVHDWLVAEILARRMGTHELLA